ncbi:acyl-CoA thioesterase [Fusarium falciforme]
MADHDIFGNPPYRYLPTQHMLAIAAAPEQGEDVYTNTAPLWHPVWARGVFGGALLAQSLAVAQESIPLSYLAHSMHCHFLLPAHTTTPIFYRIERIRDGRTIATRRVQAYQSGKCIFTALVSFFHQAERKERMELTHQPTMPEYSRGQEPPSASGEDVDQTRLTRTCQANRGSQYECVRISAGEEETRPESRRLRNWIRVHSQASAGSHANHGQGRNTDHRAHLTALAYISDHYFIGTVPRVHHADRFNNSSAIKSIIRSLGSDDPSSRQIVRSYQELATEELEENAICGTPTAPGHHIGMMVTLDHTIFFHNQAVVRADEWMLTEVETPWAGQQRGLVVQRIWTSNGTLVATCFQEGLVRLERNEAGSKI